MPDTNIRLTELLNRYANGASTQVEENELFDLLNNNPEQDIEPVLIEILENTEPVVDMQRRKRILSEILRQTQDVNSIQQDRKIPGQVQNDKQVVRLWRKLAVAASILLVVGLGSYFLFFNKSGKQTEIVKGPTVVPGDVKAPESNKAMITLADGRTIALESVDAGKLAQQSNVTVTKTADGKIVYSGTATEMVYNTLSNPRGSRVVDMTLSDGSRVWLNSGSSVIYPVAFVGNDRKVSITGEAYFEVAKNPSKPFKVTVKDMTVEVLGTHFNINSYSDEASIKTTLLEGAVKVTKGSVVAMLTPGQQAQLTANGQIGVNKNIEVDEIVAWKNGKFQFGDKVDIGAIMRQIARWYDVDVEYNGIFTKHFGGSISRDVSISQVLKILETTGDVRCKVEGRKVTVKPL